MNIQALINSPVQTYIEAEKKPPIGFGQFLKDSMEKVNNLQLESQKQDMLFALGETDNLHEVMIAAEKAGVALQFTIEVKNKILDAYKEIMRIQL